MKVTGQKLTGGKWTPMTIPGELTERIAMLSLCAGDDVVFKLETSNAQRYFCGTMDLVELMKKKYPSAMVIDCESAYNGIQYAPELYLVSIEAFFGSKEVAKLFPEKGWAKA